MVKVLQGGSPRCASRPPLQICLGTTGIPSDETIR
jgi:hypothetical protein